MTTIEKIAALSIGVLTLIIIATVCRVATLRDDLDTAHRDYDALQHKYDTREEVIESERRVWRENATMLIDRHWEDSGILDACLEESK